MDERNGTQAGRGGLEALLGGEAGRLAVCAAAAAAAVWCAGAVCQGRGWPLWEKYGPWLTANKLQATAILALVLYGVWTALDAPEGRGCREEGFSPV